MTSHFLSLPRVAALSVATTVLASSMAAAQTPASTQPANETAQTSLLGFPPFAALVPVKRFESPGATGTTQGPAASPADVKRAVGTEVRVTSTNGSEQLGTFVSLSASEVVLRAPNGDSVLPLAQVQRVKRTSNRVGKFAGIGLLVGLGVGTLAVMSCLEGECPGVLGLVIGAGSGASVGAVVDMGLNRARADRDVIYEAGRTSTQIAPILSPQRAGLAFAVRW